MARGEHLIGKSADLVDGGAGLRFVAAIDGAERAAFAVRYRGKLEAYVNECRHQSTELDWAPGEFFDEEKEHLVCATHGATYEPDTGRCVAGPCRGAYLARLVVGEREGDVFWIDQKP